MTIADRYSLETELEQGRFGTTYRAVDLRRTGAGRRVDVALWVLAPEFAHEGPALDAFRHDLERVQQLTHPNIVRVLEFGRDGEQLFVASELTDGETLRSVLDALGSERLDAGEADIVIESVGSALDHAHERGIVHGDVRPENIIVTGDQRVKLANFALASLARDTPFAPAPVDDMRALGELAHELYCGVPLRRGDRASGLKRVPKRRRKAIEAALAAPRGGVRSAGESLASAGLSWDAPRSHPRRPQPFRGPPRLSPWRFALPVAGLAALSLALYAGDDIDWQRALVAVTSSTSGGDREQDGAAAPTTNPDRATSAAAAVPSPPPAGLAEPTTPRAGPTVAPATGPGDDGGTAPPRAEAPAATTPAPKRVEAPATATPAPTRVEAPARATPPPARARGGQPPADVRLSARSITVYENQRVARIDVVRTGAAAHALEVAWWTTDGTAHAGDDYASFGARIEAFAPGQTKRTLFVPLAGDAIVERPETFFVHVALGAKPKVADDELTAEVRIVDDDR